MRHDQFNSRSGYILVLYIIYSLGVCTHILNKFDKTCYYSLYIILVHYCVKICLLLSTFGLLIFTFTCITPLLFYIDHTILSYDYKCRFHVKIRTVCCHMTICVGFMLKLGQYFDT